MKYLIASALALFTVAILINPASAQRNDDTVLDDVVEGVFEATTTEDDRRYRHPHYPGHEHPERYPGYYGMYRRVPPTHPGHHTTGHPGQRNVDPDIDVEL